MHYMEDNVKHQDNCDCDVCILQYIPFRNV